MFEIKKYTDVFYTHNLVYDFGCTRNISTVRNLYVVWHFKQPAWIEVKGLLCSSFMTIRENVALNEDLQPSPACPSDKNCRLILK